MRTRFGESSRPRWPHLIAGILSLACLLPGVAGETEERTVTPLFADSVNVDTSDGVLRLRGTQRQDEAEPVCMEAERAAAIRFVKGKGEVGRGAEATGGLYVAHVQHMEFHFELETPGQYTAWYRASFPWAGNWNHTENMDGGKTQTVADSRGDVLNEWIWTKGPTYSLRDGRHAWSFTPFAWMGGARLDRVVLAPAGDAGPESTGPTSSPRTSGPSGWAVTQPLPGRRVARWGVVSFDELAGVGGVAVDVSVDDGRTWTELPGDRDLSAVPAGASPVLRFRLQEDGSGQAPVVANVAVGCLVVKAPPIVLENDRVRWRFAGETGAICGIRNKLTGTDYSVEGVQSPLFAFRIRREPRGLVKELPFDYAELVGVERPTENELLLRHEMESGGIATALSIRLEADGSARCGLRVDNRSLYAICEVKFPILCGLRIGADEKDDYLMQPITTGSIVKYPASLKFPRLIYTDRPLVYPGLATMCWTDLWDEAGGGLYLACEDKQVRYTEFSFAPGMPSGSGAGNAVGATVVVKPGDKYKYADPPGEFIHLGFVKQILIDRTTGPVQLPDVVVTAHEGDWHWGGDKYRAWAESWMRKKRRLPDWYRDAEGWVDSHMIHHGAFVDMAKGYARNDRLIRMDSLPFPICAMWCQHTSCEAYWATPVLHYVQGSAEEFAGGIAKHHEMGNRWISYVLPPRINPLFHKGAKRNGCVPIAMMPDDEVPPEGFYTEVGARRYDGSLYQPDGVYCEGLCDFGNPTWREYLKHIVLDKYIRTYGCDGMYLDAMGLVTYRRDSRNHGYGYGEWHRAFHDWLEEVRYEARKVRPGAIFAGEGMGDVDHQFLDVGLFGGDNAPHVYRYTIPWTMGTVNGPPQTNCADYAAEDYLDYITVFGLKFGNIGTTYAPDPERFRTYVRFRRLFSQFQYRARFVDEAGVMWSDPAVKGKLYVRDDANTKGALAVVFNKNGTPGLSVRVDRGRAGEARSTWAYTLDGVRHRLQPARTAEGWRVDLPASRLTALLLFERTEPFIDIGPIDPVVPGGEGTARVTLRNLDSRPLRGTLSLDLPRRWRGEKADVALPSGAEGTFELGFRVSKRADHDVHDLYAVVRERGRTTRKCRPMGVCRAVQAELHWVEPGAVRLAMGNRSARRVDAICRLSVPDPVRVGANDVPVRLEAQEVGEVVFRLHDVAAVRTREHIRAHVTYRRQTSVAYELLQPPVLNGGFEQCVAGDGWPDYWNYRKPQHMMYKGAALDTEVCCEGGQSLRIDPLEGQRDNFFTTTLIQLVPGTRYRLHCSIRRSASHPGIGIRFYSLGPQDKSKRIDFTLGYRKDGAVGAWEHFEREFVSAEIKLPYELIVFNSTYGKATAWFDDIRIVPVEP